MAKEEIPQARRKDITYDQIVCIYHPKKKDPHHTSITMGGNLINYPDNYETPTADILTIKFMFNSIISTPNSKFMTIDIKNIYLMMPDDHYKYYRMKLELFPQDIINEYQLCNKVDTASNVFCEVQRGLYGLPRLALLLKNSSPNASTKKDTGRAQSHRDTGVMTGAPSASPLLSTI
jgi:hypothetical protein